MKKLLITCFAALLVNCTSKFQGNVYVTNHSSEPFDNTHMVVSINHQVVFDAPVVNQYISHHWLDTAVIFNKGSNHIHVEAYGEHYHLQVDSSLYISEPSNLFVKFLFDQYYDKYVNPEIYKHITGEVTEIAEFADSLYENKIISGVGYLDDSIPTVENISFIAKPIINPNGTEQE